MSAQKVKARRHIYLDVEFTLQLEVMQKTLIQVRKLEFDYFP